MRNLVIFGDSQFAERLYKNIVFEQMDTVVAFTQEEKFISRNEIQGIPVIPFERLSTCLDISFEIIIGIGYSKMNALRRKMYDKCKEKRFEVASYISSKAIIYTDAIEEGCFISPGVILGPDVKLGVCNYLEAGVILPHDNTIGNFNFLSANVVLGGFATIGNRCFFGLHSTVKNDVHIADENLIGQSANVLNTISYTRGVFVGNPAKQLDNRDLEEIKI